MSFSVTEVQVMHRKDIVPPILELLDYGVRGGICNWIVSLGQRKLENGWMSTEPSS